MWAFKIMDFCKVGADEPEISCFLRVALKWRKPLRNPGHCHQKLNRQGPGLLALAERMPLSERSRSAWRGLKPALLVAGPRQGARAEN